MNISHTIYIYTCMIYHYLIYNISIPIASSLPSLSLSDSAPRPALVVVVVVVVAVRDTERPESTDATLWDSVCRLCLLCASRI
jgi:hypothetical protein